MQKKKGGKIDGDAEKKEIPEKKEMDAEKR